MQKEIIGSHYIDVGTTITDNLTNLKYVVIHVTGEGLRQKRVTSIGDQIEIFTSYAQIENLFVEGKINIEGYNPEDLKILHLVLNDMRKNSSTKKVVQQYSNNGYRVIKKKVSKFRF